jgi:hypothetical protein
MENDQIAWLRNVERERRALALENAAMRRMRVQALWLLAGALFALSAAILWAWG